MTKYFLAILIWLSAPNIFAADFGIGNWGDSRDSILSNETKLNLTPIGQFDYLVYETSFGSIQDIKLVYRFRQDKLLKGVFIFNVSMLEPDMAIEQYEYIKATLSGVYGTPMADDQLRPEGMTSSGMLGQDLINNQLILQSEWQNESTKILHQLTENNGSLHHQLVYLPKIIKITDDADSLF